MTRKERVDEYLRYYATLSPEEQITHSKILIEWILAKARRLAVERPPATPEPVNPEDVDHVDQAAVGATFYELMDGVL
jgi:hypothetical protein